MKDKKPKKIPVSALKKKCDDLLSPIMKRLHPRCLLCGNETQVAHHHVHKSKSLALRYYIPNLIPLCNGCHLKLHYNESYWASYIVEKKGLRWFRDLEKNKNIIVKGDRTFYERTYQNLCEMMSL